MQINPIFNWSGNFLHIIIDLLGRASALMIFIPPVAARTGVLRGDQNKPRWKINRVRLTRDDYAALLKWLTQGFQNLPRVFGEFIQKQYPAMGQGYFTRPGHTPATHQRNQRGRMVGMAKGTI